jgi:hypothetical protein
MLFSLYAVSLILYMVRYTNARSVCGKANNTSPQYAVVTMVGGNGRYVKAANVQLHSVQTTMDHNVLQHTQFIVIVTDEHEAYTSELNPGWIVCKPPRIVCVECSAVERSVMFEKLWVYELLDFERVLFIDADAFAVGDVSPLLTAPDLKSIAVTPDLFDTKPLEAGAFVEFNTGVFSIKPSNDEFFKINKFRMDNPTIGNEQSLLNAYYRSQLGSSQQLQYMQENAVVSWFNFSFNAYIFRLSGDDTPSSGNWDAIWSHYTPKVIIHLIGNCPPPKPDAVTNARTAAFSKWWEAYHHMRNDLDSGFNVTHHLNCTHANRTGHFNLTGLNCTHANRTGGPFALNAT